VAANRTQKLVFPTYRSWLRRYQSLPVSHARHTVIRADFRDALADLPDAVAAIYADPPYTRDHYSRFYHVLETISLGDEPRISTVKIGGRTTLSRALYRLERHQSPFCVKTQVEGAFNDLFAASAQRGVPIIVSYSPYSAGTAARPLTRVIGTAGLMDLATEHFSKVQVTSAGRVAHSKLNVERLNAEVSYNAEVFLIAIP
jgi:adenine-specific DNA methylase